MKLEWHNGWMHKPDEWHPLAATSLDQAGAELSGFLPQAEEGTKVRNADDHAQTWNWSPPGTHIHFAP